MAAKRKVPIPLVIVLLCAVGAIFVLNREAPLQRASGPLATTSLEVPIRTFSEAWSVAERVLEEKQHEFTLRTLVVAVPVDRDAPPNSMHLAFRSVTNDREFYIRIDKHGEVHGGADLFPKTVANAVPEVGASTIECDTARVTLTWETLETRREALLAGSMLIGALSSSQSFGFYR